MMSMHHFIEHEESLGKKKPNKQIKLKPVTAPNANFNSRRKNLQSRLMLGTEIFKAISYNHNDARGKKISYVLRL